MLPAYREFPKGPRLLFVKSSGVALLQRAATGNEAIRRIRAHDQNGVRQVSRVTLHASSLGCALYGQTAICWDGNWPLSVRATVSRSCGLSANLQRFRRRARTQALSSSCEARYGLLPPSWLIFRLTVECERPKHLAIDSATCCLAIPREEIRAPTASSPTAATTRKRTYPTIGRRLVTNRR